MRAFEWMTRRRFLAAAGVSLGGLIARPSWAEEEEKTPEGLLVRCRYDGDPPEPRILDCSEDPYCARQFRKDPLLDDSLLVDEDGALRNVFVVVREGLGEGRTWSVPDTPAAMDQDCRFIPRIVGVQVGQPLQFHNSAGTLEVPHGYPKRNPEFSFNMTEDMTKQVTFEFPETFHLECDVHPWELSFCHVVAHPFFVLTDAKGRAAITGLPAGAYEVEFWHETLGVQRRTVKIDERGGVVRLDEIVFQPPRRRHRRGGPTAPPATRPTTGEG